MQLNIHDVKSIKLGQITTWTKEKDGTDCVGRTLTITPKDGEPLLILLFSKEHSLEIAA